MRPLEKATFRGWPIEHVAELLNPQGTTPCWSSGGGTGSSNGAHKLLSYRLDALRFLERELDKDGKPTGRRLVNDEELNQRHIIELPDSGVGNQAPLASGASLVAIYREKNGPAPFRSIVVYDGGYTMDQANDSMTQTLEGFYESSATPAARMTHIVGDGQANFDERVLFNNTPIRRPGHAGCAGAVLGARTVRRGTDYTVRRPLPANASSATVRVDHGSFTPFDCLSWSAIILSTEVQDTDEDGLLDVWEKSSPPPSDPNGAPLPNYNAMGADKNIKDLFYEVGYMTSATGYTTPLQGEVAPHDHVPDLDALQKVVDAFDKAGIRVHFDVGPKLYQKTATQPGLKYVVPAEYAEGGDVIPEKTCNPLKPEATCAFPDYYGVVAWKSGFKAYRDRPLNYRTEVDCLANERPGVTPANRCKRRFSTNRHDGFHYALFAHALGIGREGAPTTPRSASGIGDFPGGDILITLGFFVDERDARSADIQRHGADPGIDADARNGSQPVAASWRGSRPAELQAQLPERDELSVPDSWTGQGRRRAGH